MDNHQKETDFRLEKVLWEAAEGLISTDPDIREKSLDRFKEIDGFSGSPLLAYVLVSRINEPDREIRYYLIQLLGSLVDYESPGEHFSDQALVTAKKALDLLGRDQLIRILEVSEHYLTAEVPICNILKLSSYAGVGLSGIVNDRKIPVSMRQQAVFFCGEVGYLSTRPTLQNLVQRVDKSRSRPGGASDRKKSREDELLYPFVISALEKMKP